MSALRVTFSLFAWLKFRWFLHRADTEIGFLCVTDHPDDPLYITDVLIPKQRCTPADIQWDTDSISQLVDECLDCGLSPSQCLTIVAHTHPGSSATPSSTDDDDFRVLTAKGTSVQLICSRTEELHARISIRDPTTRLTSPPQKIPVRIDYSPAYTTPITCPTLDWEAIFLAQVSKPIYEASTFPYGDHALASPSTRLKAAMEKYKKERRPSDPREDTRQDTRPQWWEQPDDEWDGTGLTPDVPPPDFLQEEEWRRQIEEREAADSALDEHFRSLGT